MFESIQTFHIYRGHKIRAQIDRVESHNNEWRKRQRKCIILHQQNSHISVQDPIITWSYCLSLLLLLHHKYGKLTQICDFSTVAPCAEEGKIVEWCPLINEIMVELRSVSETIRSQWSTYPSSQSYFKCPTDFSEEELLQNIKSVIGSYTSAPIWHTRCPNSPTTLFVRYDSSEA